jgi:hypothetical protein
MGTLEQIAKYRYFQISEIVCHLICRVASGMLFCALVPYPGLYVVEPIDLVRRLYGRNHFDRRPDVCTDGRKPQAACRRQKS